ncbi:MAG: adenylate kinase [Halobacteriota archaeon]|nr:adenylate kinase [Halobacteriota archaeon]
MMSKIVVITGMPGVGKTTVLEGALEMANKEGADFRCVNYGDVMFETVQKEGLAEVRDDMRRLEPEVQKRVQKLAASSISEAGGNTIVDTHATIKTPKGYLPGLPEWVLKALQPTNIVLIEADPKEIASRRKGDSSRVRDDELESSMEEHQSINRAVAMSYAMYTGATVKIIMNHDLDTAVRELADLLKN